MLTLAEIQAEIDRRATRIGASGYVLPTYGRTEDFARPHLEVDGRGYHYVVVERGQELERVTTPDLDELLYVVFGSVTFSLATAWECKHRIKGQDVRRQMFRHEVELLRQLDPRWAERKAKELEQVLQAHPFRDGS